MEYNTSRDKLVMPEYGRNIQSMVDYCLTIRDRDERTRCAATIVKVIISLFPKVKEDDNYKQKVWDHLALISNYRLDVDAPYPIRTHQEATEPAARHIPYPMSSIKLRTYGSLVQRMLDYAVSTPNEYDRLQTVALTALYMKKQVLQNGKDSNAEDRVVADIEELSGGKLRYDFTELMAALPQEQPQEQPRKQWGQQRQRYNAGNNGSGNNANNGYRKYNNNSNNNNGGNNNGNGRKFGNNNNKRRY